jgi:hypothetical protein
MAKVLKSAAYETAKLMANNAINPKIKTLKDEQKTIITAAAIRATPLHVLNLFDNNEELKPYFKTGSSFRYRCDGLNEDYDYYYPLRDIPRTNTSSEYLDVNRMEYDRLIELKREVTLLNSQKSKLQDKIEATILSLGTYKRVEKEFPEAYAVIPQRYTNPEPVQTIALPIDDLKAELLKYSK